MYGEFFSIDESAFSIAPNPKYLYLSAQHQEVLAHLLYGVTRSGGFVLITGEIGTGKTTVCRSLFAEIPDNADIALIVNPKLDPVDLLASICDELNISYPDTPLGAKTFLNKLNERLIESHAQGRNTILIIDEAQNLSNDALETIRGLTNLETDEQKLLQIILIGQPELRDRLNTHAMEQLNQRITARFHLQALDRNEVASYIQHRLTVAKADPKIFSKSNIDYIYKLTGGVPRLINVLCDRSLLGAFVQKKKKITNEIIYNAASESLGKRKKRNQPATQSFSKVAGWSGAIILAAITAGVILYDSSEIIEVKEIDEIVEHNNELNPPIDEQPINIAALTSEEDEVAVEEIQQDVSEAIEIHQDQVESGIAGDVSNEALSESVVSNYIQDSSQTIPVTNDDAIIVNNEVEDIVLTSEQWAYQSLISAWGIDYQQFDIDPCEFISEQGLYCFSSEGDKALLERLNRPVILVNKNHQGDSNYLLIKEIQRDNVLVIDQSGEYQVAWEDINTSWQGEFILIWKSLANKEFIKPGDKGEFVVAVDEQLATIFNRTPNWEELDSYNRALVREVRDFQRAQKISADGVIGPLTQIFMNNIVNADVPKLR